jgi:hypothetical protein
MRVWRDRPGVYDCLRGFEVSGFFGNGLFCQTPGVTQDLGAIFGSRGRWFPSAGNASIEQFVGGRLVIPDGDRRQSTESRGIVNEPDTAGMSNDDIVGVFVLNDDILHHLKGF